MKRFLVAGDHAVIADTLLKLQSLTDKANGILDEDRICPVEFREGLFVFALYHHLRLGGDGGNAQLN